MQKLFPLLQDQIQIDRHILCISNLQVQYKASHFLHYEIQRRATSHSFVVIFLTGDTLFENEDEETGQGDESGISVVGLRI